MSTSVINENKCRSERHTTERGIFRVARTLRLSENSDLKRRFSHNRKVGTFSDFLNSFPRNLQFFSENGTKEFLQSKVFPTFGPKPLQSWKNSEFSWIFQTRSEITTQNRDLLFQISKDKSEIFPKVGSWRLFRSQEISSFRKFRLLQNSLY